MKLNKTQTIVKARELARTNQAAQAQTLTDIAAMDAATRRQLADSLAFIALTEVDPKYLQDANREFINTVVALWADKERQHEKAVASFERACQGISVEEAEDKLQALLGQMQIRGARVSRHSMEVSRTGRNSSGPTLYWSWDSNFIGLSNPDDPQHRVYAYSLDLKISTGGTSYSLPEMALVNKIQAELLDAANEVAVFFANERVIRTWGGPEQPAAAEAL